MVASMRAYRACDALGQLKQGHVSTSARCAASVEWPNSNAPISWHRWPRWPRPEQADAACTHIGAIRPTSEASELSGTGWQHRRARYLGDPTIISNASESASAFSWKSICTGSVLIVDFFLFHPNALLDNCLLVSATNSAASPTSETFRYRTKTGAATHTKAPHPTPPPLPFPP